VSRLRVSAHALGLGRLWRSLVPGAALARWTAGPLPYVLAVLLALVLAGGGWAAVQARDAHQRAQRDQAVLAAARQTAVNFLSLDYRTYDRDMQNVVSGATGALKQQFASQSKQLSALVAQNKSVSQGQVIEAGILRADNGSAKVLVVADSQVQNTQIPKGQTRNYRLQLDLTRSGGRWLTSDLAFVS
jgi:Mce-associated membrane protein